MNDKLATNRMRHDAISLELNQLLAQPIRTTNQKKSDKTHKQFDPALCPLPSQHIEMHEPANEHKKAIDANPILLLHSAYSVELRGIVRLK